MAPMNPYRRSSVGRRTSVFCWRASNCWLVPTATIVPPHGKRFAPRHIASTVYLCVEDNQIDILRVGGDRGLRVPAIDPARAYFASPAMPAPVSSTNPAAASARHVSPRTAAVPPRPVREARSNSIVGRKGEDGGNGITQRSGATEKRTGGRRPARDRPARSRSQKSCRLLAFPAFLSLGLLAAPSSCRAPLKVLLLCDPLPPSPQLPEQAGNPDEYLALTQVYTARSGVLPDAAALRESFRKGLRLHRPRCSRGWRTHRLRPSRPIRHNSR